MTLVAPGVEGGTSGVNRADRRLRPGSGNTTGDGDASSDHVEAQRPVARALEIDDVDEGRLGRHDARHELFDGLAKDDAFEVALFEANGVVTKEVECGDHLHSSVLAC